MVRAVLVLSAACAVVATSGQTMFGKHPYRDPPTLRSPLWVSFAPSAWNVLETVNLTFTGFLLQSNEARPDTTTMQAKISDATCTVDVKGGLQRSLTKDAPGTNWRAEFTIPQPGFYRVCIKHRTEWEPVGALVKVD